MSEKPSDTLPTLLESRPIFARLFEESQTGMLLSGEEHRILDANPALCEFLGCSRDELTGMTFVDVTHPDDLAMSEKFAAEKYGPRSKSRVEKRYITKRGTVVWGSVHSTTIRDDNGDFLFGLVMIEDITARKRAEFALLSKEEELHAIANNVDALISYLDKDLCYRFVNKAYERLFGVGADQIIGRCASEVLDPEVFENAKPHYDVALRGQSVSYQGVFKSSDLVPRHSLVKLAPDLSPEGEVRGIFVVVSDITDLKRVQSNLEAAITRIDASEARFRDHLESLPEGILIVDADSKIFLVNEQLERMFGYGRSDLVGESTDLLVPVVLIPDENSTLQTSHSSAPAGSSISAREFTARRHDGSEFPAEINLSPVQIDGHNFGLGIIRDVTERHAGIKSRLELAAIVEASDDAIIRSDLDRTIQFWSKGAERIYGYTAKEMVGRSMVTIAEPGREHILRDIGRRLETGEHISVPDAPAVTKDGRSLRISASIFPISNPEGVVIGSASVHRDITAYRKAIESQLELAAVVEASDDAIIRSDLDQVVQFWSKGAEDIYGYRSEEMVGQSMTKIVQPDRQFVMPQIAGKIRAGEKVSVPDAVGMGKGGVPVRVSISVFPIKNAAGVVVGAAAVHRDTSAYRAAIDSRLELGAIVEASSDAIIRTTLKGKVEFWSPGAERIYGYTREEAVGGSIARILGRDGKRVMDDIGARAAAGDSISAMETVRYHRDGRPVDVSISVFPVTNASGEVIGAASVHRDITEQKRLEERLRHSQRLESIGRLAGGVAHDFNNILTVIQGYCTLIESELSQDAPTRKKLSAVENATDRAATLTRQLLAFSRKQRIETRIFDLNRMLSSLMPVLRKSLREDIEVSADLKSSWSAKGDPVQLEQVVLNLAVNAGQAMPKGGKLTIATSDCVRDAEGSESSRRVTRFAPEVIEPGDYVRLTVEDDGMGIAPETLSKIFEPFFTTRQVGEGTGLGLSAAYGAVAQLGGGIEVESDLGERTCISIFLPRVATEVEEPTASVSPEEGESRGTVLLVEDNEDVLTLTKAILGSEGYSVLHAGSPEEALSEFSGAKVDLVLTDVVMPGMSGPDFVERWQKISPGTRVLYMSGYVDDAVVSDEVGADKLLPKPFSPPELVRRVTEALAE